VAETTPEYRDEAESSESARGYAQLFRVAWARKSLLALGVAVALTLGALYYAQCAPVYQSSARVLVIKKRPDAVTALQTQFSHFEDYVSTHQMLITSPLIVERAIKNSNLATLKSFAGTEERLAEVIIKRLSAKRKKDSSENILNLTFQGPVADECTTVLNAILGSYKDFLDETYRNISDDTLVLIKNARDMLQKELAAKEVAYRAFREKAPLIWKGREGSNPRQDRLASIDGTGDQQERFGGWRQERHVECAGPDRAPPRGRRETARRLWTQSSAGAVCTATN
jgi:capsular polysaccharide biosynthesis protein